MTIGNDEDGVAEDYFSNIVSCYRNCRCRLLTVADADNRRSLLNSRPSQPSQLGSLLEESGGCCVECVLLLLRRRFFFDYFAAAAASKITNLLPKIKKKKKQTKIIKF